MSIQHITKTVIVTRDGSAYCMCIASDNSIHSSIYAKAKFFRVLNQSNNGQIDAAVVSTNTVVLSDENLNPLASIFAAEHLSHEVVHGEVLILGIGDDGILVDVPNWVEEYFIKLVNEVTPPLNTSDWKAKWANYTR